VKPLENPDLHHLRAAEGWLELGDHLEANQELENIAPQLRAHPAVLKIRWHIYAKENRWEACVDIAASLVKLAPKCSDNWIHQSFALHALNKTQEALDNLLPAAKKFSDIWQIPYNLACYCSVLGRFDEAQHWFKKAIVVDDKTVQQAGIDDPDLKPLWDSLSTTIWKKNE
jgi:tetratricopeptide (TPR) repeat protein